MCAVPMLPTESLEPCNSTLPTLAAAVGQRNLKDALSSSNIAGFSDSLLAIYAQSLAIVAPVTAESWWNAEPLAICVLCLPGSIHAIFKSLLKNPVFRLPCWR